MATEGAWRLLVDTGGTFTDCLALDPAGRWQRLKVLSSSSLRAEVRDVLGPHRLRLRADWLRRCRHSTAARLLEGCRLRLLGERAPAAEWLVVGLDVEAAVIELEPECAEATEATPDRARLSVRSMVEIRSSEEAPVLAARLLTGTPSDQPLPAIELRLATTRGTNALLERKGAACALFITRGFGDLLAIGDQSRPELFTLQPTRSSPLATEVVEVAERLAADGRILQPLDLETVDSAIDRLRQAGVDSVAVALMHADVQPLHERLLRSHLLARGFGRVALSSDLAPTIGLLARAQTATVEATLAPIIGSYLEGVRRPLGAGASALVMTSSGGLVGADHYRAVDSLLSGPAGGVVGAADAGLGAGFDRIISFDMGGTSTDVARYDGDHEYLFETRVGDAQLLVPSLAIETVAAGGGSICTFRHDRLTVGPQSAGADPGPACYGAGGPLTITDVDLLLGRLDPRRFAIPVDREASEAALESLLSTLRAAGQTSNRDQLLIGCLAIADERMADAIRRISLRRGYDPKAYCLVTFGGAGAQHACAVAELLGVRSVLVPSDAGLLSAKGLGAARVERFARRQILAPLAEVVDRLDSIVRELDDQALALVRRQTSAQEPIEVRRRLAGLRLLGQDAVLSVDLVEVGELRSAFAGAYQATYGYPPSERSVELVTLTVVASTTGAGRTAEIEPPVDSTQAAGKPKPAGCQLAWVASAGLGGRAAAGGWSEVPTFERGSLRVGDEIAGPALIFEEHSATVIEADWVARADPSSAILVTRQPPDQPPDQTRNDLNLSAGMIVR